MLPLPTQSSVQYPQLTTVWSHSFAATPLLSRHAVYSLRPPYPTESTPTSKSADASSTAYIQVIKHSLASEITWLPAPSRALGGLENGIVTCPQGACFRYGNCGISSDPSPNNDYTSREEINGHGGAVPDIERPLSVSMNDSEIASGRESLAQAMVQSKVDSRNTEMHHLVTDGYLVPYLSTLAVGALCGVLSFVTTAVL